MIKCGLMIGLLIASICAYAGNVYIINTTNRSIAIHLQLCFDKAHCGPKIPLTLSPNTTSFLTVPNYYFVSIVDGISDGTVDSAWKSNWQSVMYGAGVGLCTVQPSGPYSIFGNTAKLENRGDSTIFCETNIPVRVY